MQDMREVSAREHAHYRLQTNKLTRASAIYVEHDYLILKLSLSGV